jgi:hypothetical protein
VRVELCPLDESVPVLHVEEGDDGPMVEALKTRGHGYCIYGEKIDPVIVFDSRLESDPWWTKNHTLAVLAHELGHIRLASESEEDADREGAEILRAAKKHMAARLLARRKRD